MKADGTDDGPAERPSSAAAAIGAAVSYRRMAAGEAERSPARAAGQAELGGRGPSCNTFFGPPAPSHDVAPAAA
ncbi:MAG TPA: hypothetical protein VND64_33535 [Pirellulales bacterium]|nr:hypothetical protein [Pirellulales bacterium]